MIQITGNIYDVFSSDFTDKTTGQVVRSYNVEILHKMGGKSTITPLKVDFSTFESWLKSKGRDMVVEVRSYVMKTREGGLAEGYALADKKTLPGLLRAAAPAAA